MEQEQTNNQSPSNWNVESVELSLTKIASSLYKMQLGINSLRDEVKNLVDLKTAEHDERTSKQ